MVQKLFLNLAKFLNVSAKLHSFGVSHYNV